MCLLLQELLQVTDITDATSDDVGVDVTELDISGTAV